tara:strand:- start:1454 stop:2812 length:1359 start_codon:yes stop_codon:yes gene_type:complete
MATSKSYCTERDLMDIYPQIANFDTQIPILGWDLAVTNMADNSVDLFYAASTGLVTQLFFNGIETKKLDFPTTTSYALGSNLAIDGHTVTLSTSDASDFVGGSIFKINDEYFIAGQTGSGTDIKLFPVAIANTPVFRGLLGTTSQAHTSGDAVYLVIDGSKLDEGYTSLEYDDPNIVFTYDSALDMCFMLFSTTSDGGVTTDKRDPRYNNITSGEDYSTLITRMISNASRYFDSRVDANLPRDQWKDREGNYDYMVVRTTALVACAFLIRATDPQSVDADNLIKEYEFNFKQINEGKVKMAHHVTADSSKGTIREVSGPANANPLYIVDTRGNYVGTYDLFKIYIDTSEGGAIGTAKYSVKQKDSTGLKQSLAVDSEVITGDWQKLGGGLQIRFQGKNDSAIATAGDEWEIECHGMFEETENSSSHGTTKMTRTDNPYRRKRNYDPFGDGGF